MKYDIEAAIPVTPGEWRSNGYTIAAIRPNVAAQQFQALADTRELDRKPLIKAGRLIGVEQWANGRLMAASKDLAQAAIGARAAILALQRDPELVIDWSAHLAELDEALTKAGLEVPAREE